MTGTGTLRHAEHVSPRPGSITLLGVPICNATKAEAVSLLQSWIRARDGRARSVFIANAHTLNLACESPVYRAVLRGADVVFGDGTGVRLAARISGVRMRDNLVGTDLVPMLMERSLAMGCRHFLLGSTTDTVSRAAATLADRLPGIEIAGTHHGYIDDSASRTLVAHINAARPDVLLVAMGNPLQECWIARHLPHLRVPVSIGVGGLFDHWAGNLVRAPRWVRRVGFEWLQILLQQPGAKWRRYLLGNPMFVSRVVRDAVRSERCAGS